MKVALLLTGLAKEHGCEANVITAIEEVKDAQNLVIARKTGKRFGEDLTGHTFACWL